MDALTSPVMRLKGTLHLAGTPDIKMADFGGSALVYVSNCGSVKPRDPFMAPVRTRLRILLTFSTRVENVVDNALEGGLENARFVPVPAIGSSQFLPAKNSPKSLFYRIANQYLGLCISAKERLSAAQEAGASGPIREAQLYRSMARTDGLFFTNGWWDVTQAAWCL